MQIGIAYLKVTETATGQVASKWWTPWKPPSSRLSEVIISLFSSCCWRNPWTMWRGTMGPVRNWRGNHLCGWWSSKEGACFPSGLFNFHRSPAVPGSIATQAVLVHGRSLYVSMANPDYTTGGIYEFLLPLELEVEWDSWSWCDERPSQEKRVGDGLLQSSLLLKGFMPTSYKVCKL